MARFHVSRQPGGDLITRILDDSDEHTAIVELEIYVDDQTDQKIRVVDKIECPDHYQSGGLCSICGGRGSSFATKVKIAGFEIVDGDLTTVPEDGWLRGSLKIVNGHTVPIGEFAIDTKQRKRFGSGNDVINCDGTWLTLAYKDGHIKVVPSGTIGHTFAAPTTSTTQRMLNLVILREGVNIFVDGLPFAHGSVHGNAEGTELMLNTSGTRLRVDTHGKRGIKVDVIRGETVLFSMKTTARTLELDWNVEGK